MTTHPPPPTLPETLPETLREDARAWVRKLHSGAATQWEAQAFRRWRDASPLHQAAFIEARQQWRVLQPALNRLVRTDAEAANLHRETLRKPEAGRRAFLGVAGAAAAAGVAGMAVYSPLGLWPAANEWRADWRTAAGEQRAITWSDQIGVTLNTRTSIRRVASDDQAEGLELLNGEAAIEMLPGTRHFSVVAGAGRSIGESARFEISRLEGRVCVTCLAGRVRIEHPAGDRLLLARQQAVYRDHSISGIAAADPEVASAWRRGELVFKQAPLSVVLDEINRYRPGRVVLMVDSLRGKTVTATFKLDRLDLALLQMQRSFGLNARSLPAGVLVLS
ncbi:FecR family protein [Variovorax sp. 54]|uniref:FecR family protein n=1 Tax=Variovorax sp. 54 TaxID=2035212 RepID=UPI000C1A5337|nr:FecR domain-containing protein [Variovorax sp. 54]PIF73886.1 FecR family protein [Variovorax sp. 54]